MVLRAQTTGSIRKGKRRVELRLPFSHFQFPPHTPSENCTKAATHSETLQKRFVESRATFRITYVSLSTLYEEMACANLQASLISRLGCGQTFSEFSQANDRWLIKSKSGRRLFMPVSREIAVSAHKLIGAGGQGEKSRL